MFKYLMIAMLCLVVAKTTARMAHFVHYANPTAFSQAGIP
jgi:hypothetical protein